MPCRCSHRLTRILRAFGYEYRAHTMRWHHPKDHGFVVRDEDVLNRHFSTALKVLWHESRCRLFGGVCRKVRGR